MRAKLGSSDPFTFRQLRAAAGVAGQVASMKARRVLDTLLTPALLTLTLAVGALVLPPEPGFGAPLEMAAFALLGSLAALHRLVAGGILGLGTAVLLPAISRLGPVSSAIVLTAAVLTAEALRRGIERSRREAPLPERRGLVRVVTQASLAGLGTFLAALSWRAAVAGDPVPGLELVARAALIAGVAYLLPAAVHDAVTRRSRRDESVWKIAGALGGWAGELPGVAVGALVVATAWIAGWQLGWIWLGLVALLGFEAARQSLIADAARRSLAESVRVSRAGASLATSGSELARLAHGIFSQCADLVPFAFAMLEMASPESGEMHFWARADCVPNSGEPDPPAYPPPLPGFHRREPWRIFDRALLDEEERRARLRLWCDPRRIEPRLEASLEALVAQLSTSVRGALLDREATIDRLTGAANRRAFERRVTEAFAACSNDGRPLALVLGDIDHFKKINDSLGHPTGDRALEAVARVLLGPNRGRDFCARYGGEEFVLVLEDTSGETALEIAERLRRRIERLELEVAEGPVPLSMSFGVAAYPELPVRSPQELFELADGALYTAKRLGRNLAVLDLGGGSMRTGAGGEIDIAEAPPTRPPVFFA